MVLELILMSPSAILGRFQASMAAINTVMAKVKRFFIGTS